MGCEYRDTLADDRGVHPKVGNHQYNGDSDGFFEAFEEDATQQQNKPQRDANLPRNRIVFHEFMEHRVFPDVRGGIRC